ncbi:MAG: formate--tetrahydrofolate ligase [Rickettsiales bacterium]|jgi:formate--tetrahydrofolate ligase|nr:formate--tetrahydrofolate ligase [Rickettsiales bacterium]
MQDIDIARATKLKPISEIARKVGLEEEDLEFYGKYKAKISPSAADKFKDRDNGKLILVTAINPTPAGEGKTTQAIGLGQALSRLGKKTVLALREPSLGPCMGVKGGATGGGYSQIAPMEDINLHFTGDIHAITTSHNLVSSLIDNHIYFGNKLKFRDVVWKRALDLNDRALRNIIVGNSERAGGKIREDSFMITVASEIMAVLCLSENLGDLRRRLGKIILGYNYDNEPITMNALQCVGALMALLRDAVKPNLAQTLEGVPALIHGGPFANIAHGCNSIAATKLALKMADYVVTEAGFGADLGAEKFFDIKCRQAGLTPSAVMLVATCRSLKYNGGLPIGEVKEENLDALERGAVNLEQHAENLKKFNVPVVVCLNKFTFDGENEIDFVRKKCKELGVGFAVSEAWAKGGEGCVDAAREILKSIEENKKTFNFLYGDDLSLIDKIKTIAKEIYRAADVDISTKLIKKLEKFEQTDGRNLQICIAKTQYSFSDRPELLGAPKDFTLKIADVKLSAGAGFVVCLAGDIMTMPGLSKSPAALGLDLDENGNISGLF